MMHKFRVTKGKKGFIAWNIYLFEAYDRMNWDFIMDILKEIGIAGFLA